MAMVSLLSVRKKEQACNFCIINQCDGIAKCMSSQHDKLVSKQFNLDLDLKCIKNILFIVPLGCFNKCVIFSNVLCCLVGY